MAASVKSPRESRAKVAPQPRRAPRVAGVTRLPQVPEVEPRKHLRDRLLSLDELGALAPVRPLVDGLLYRNTLVQIAGQPGSYKSFVTIGMACSVALGRSWEGHRVPEAGSVVYVAPEGASGLRTRVLAWCELSGADPVELAGRLRFLPEPVQLGNSLDVSEACDVARELDAALVVLDTRARCTLGLSENDATEQGRAIHAAERIQKATGTTVLGVHHSGRGGDHGRGSNAWDGAVWSDLRMTGEDLRCRIHCEKHKDAADGCDHHFRMVPHTVAERHLPRLVRETPEEWSQRRSTLVAVQNGVWTNDADDRRSTRTVLDIIRTKGGAEGLTRAQAVELSIEAGVSRSAAYEATSALTQQALIRNVGSEKRARYVALNLSPLTEPEA